MTDVTTPTRRVVADPAERFLPGQILIGRYRIVERVGKGGMGEVYRARDLDLGEFVALKFLPEGRDLEPESLEMLLEEVRLARRVSHPNVCRVHDLEDLAGTRFLSMEFVDGEDLQHLLRRIGRLPFTKAVQLAWELCAGLGAIHEHGVLHRDLKPANVMIDGRGRARITDFGLAQPNTREGDPGLIIGTPAYLAPECLLEGRAATVESDVYSLGLVLYELFTGHLVFTATTLPELLKQRRDGTVPSPRRHVPDLDQAVERAIMRCLEPVPARRPSSARAVAALLPGGDPIAVAIAAGDTPSPEMVAGATLSKEGLQPAHAWGCLAALVVGLVAMTLAAPQTRVVPALSLTDPPQTMAAHARDLVKDRDGPAVGADHAYGYRFDEGVVDSVVAVDHSPGRWRALSDPASHVVTFWYRQSPSPLVPRDRWDRVTDVDPPPFTPGMVGVRLDARGQPVSIEMAPASTAARTSRADPSGRVPHLMIASGRPLLVIVVLLFGAWLARRNLRGGRGDVKRAVRVALLMLVLRLVIWLLGGHYTAATLMDRFTTALAWGLEDAVYGALFYIAVEPYVRRLWPRMLTSWVRLLDGQIRDARVGRDLLIGSITGVALALLVAAHQAAPVLFGAPPGRPDNVGYVEHQLASLLSPTQQLAEMAWLYRSNLVMLMGFMVILVLLRLVLRRSRLAVLATVALFVPLALPKGDLPLLNVALAAGSMLLLLLALMRFGLLAAGVGLVVFATLESAPLGMALDSWPLRCTILVLAIVTAIGVYGFARSLGGRPAIQELEASA